jgi:putative beta-barrel porin BBP2
VTEGAKLQARARGSTRRPPPIERREATVTGMMTRLCTIATVLAVIWGARTASAQAVEATRPDAPLLVGPLQLFPTLTLRDIGIDSNVYNESVRHEDFTYTLSPTLKTVLPIGEARLTTRGALDFRYFQTFKDQQSTSGSLNTQLEVGSGRVRPFGTAGLVRSHERGGYDVDRRAYSLASQVKVGASLALTPVTSLTGWVVRESTKFDRLAMFDGVSLSQQLDRVTRGTATGLRFDLTPFTSVTSAIEVEKIRFAHAPLRDANSFRFAPVVQFTKGAIIEGQASAGFRDFRPIDPRLAPYRGFVASVTMAFTLMNVTHVEAQATHDVQFSYDDSQPLYLGAGGRVMVSQRVAGPFEAIVIGGRQRLRYQTIDGLSFDGRREHVTSTGGGIGIRANEHLRFTLTLDRERRLSNGSTLRDYERRLVFGSVSFTP